MADNKYETLDFECHDGLGVLTLNRPEKLNALSRKLIQDLNDFFTDIKGDFSTRVIIVRGAGRAFCAGADLSDPQMTSEDRSGYGLGPIQYTYRTQQTLSNTILSMRRCPQPIIGAIRGPAVGGGFGLALACDIRIAGESVKFSAANIRIAISGGEMGMTYFLPRLIGFSRSAEYLYTGRIIDAGTAERLGLVSRIVPDNELDEAATSLGEEIIRNSPFGIRMTKDLLNINLDSPSLESALGIESRTQTLCSFTEDFKEAAKAFVEKRTPIFHDK